jgi:hypothetical protein
MYYNKYLKYKNKYLKLLGGADENGIDTSIWYKTPNKGQQNCGIYINEKDKKLIKCTDHDHDINEIKYNYVKEELHNKYFPILYKIEHNTVLDKTITTMELLDGDITSIFFDILPKIALNKTLVDCTSISLETEGIPEPFDNYDQKDIIYRIFKLKIPETHFDEFRKNPYIEFNNYISKLNEITKIEYEEFINKVKLLINNFYNFIIIEIMDLLMALQILNFKYEDYKLDNFAYKLYTDNELDMLNKTNYYICKKKFLNKNICLYIIDYESGLSKIEIENEKDRQKYIDDINQLNERIVVNGQYKIDKLNVNIKHLMKNPSSDDISVDISDDIKNLFYNEYNNNTKDQFIQ